MGIQEVALFVAAQQFAQAVAAYLAAISPPPTNPWAAAAITVGEQFAANAAVALGAGVTAAVAELAAQQGAESSAVSVLVGLPPIA